MDRSSNDPRDTSPSDDAAHQRSASRDSLLLSAQLRVGDDPEVTVRVRNLSAGGLMAEYAAHVIDGTPIEVEVRGVGWISGRIAWSAEGRIGIAFDRQIDPLAARKPVAPPKPRPAPKPEPIRRPV